MKRLTIVFISVLIIALFSVGCETMRPLRGNTYDDIRIKELADMLNDSLRRPALKNKEIGILTFVNLNDLTEAEPIGRHVQERLSHALFGLGFRIVEIRMAPDIRFQPLTGELNLSRLKEQLKRTTFKEIQSLVLGTYQDAGDYIYVRSQLVELESSLIRASGEIKISKGEYLATLIKIDKKKKPLNKQDVYERFPVKAADK